MKANNKMKDSAMKLLSVFAEKAIMDSRKKLQIQVDKKAEEFNQIDLVREYNETSLSLLFELEDLEKRIKKHNESYSTYSIDHKEFGYSTALTYGPTAIRKMIANRNSLEKSIDHFDICALLRRAEYDISKCETQEEIDVILSKILPEEYIIGDYSIIPPLLEHKQ